jgi:type II secretory pathway pseudopilin PulG
MDASSSDDSESKIWSTIKTRWVELLGIISLAVIAADLWFASGSWFVNGVKTWASTNNGLASLILSAGLLFAYLLQFRTQDRQRVLMNQQKQIMNQQIEIMDAGYTPLIGVTQQTIKDHSSDPETAETESLELTVVNRGNSLATDLELHFLISYDTENQQYTNLSDSLRRTEGGMWWNSGSGGSISSEEDAVEFSIAAEVTDTKHSQDEPVNISDAIDSIFDNEDDIGEIEIATQLHYKDAKGNHEEIDLTIYTIQSSNGDADLRLSNANERAVRRPKESDKVTEIKT